MNQIYKIYLLVFLLAGCFSGALHAQPYASADCNLTTEGGTISSSSSSVCIGESSSTPQLTDNTAGLDVTEYALTNPQNIISDDEGTIYGAELVAFNTSGVFNPADYGFQEGDDFCITAFSYNLSDLQKLLEITLNGSFVGASCCDLLAGAVGGEICPPLNNVGIFSGDDVQEASIFLTLMEAYDVPKTMKSLVDLVDVINDNTGLFCTDGLPLCYATSNRLCYTYEECCPAAGTSCDDGNVATVNDVADGNCNCAGTACPTAGTTCDDGNPATGNDIEDGNCNCAGTACPAAGTTCDDGNPATGNDIEDGSCNCVGTACPAAGTACDDGNPATENDVADGNCNCAGTACPTAGTACDDGNPATENDVADGNCNCVGTACPAAGTACDDGNATTENDVADGNCNCAGTQPACPTVGTACDDGNASTENDIEDGSCNCAGTACPTAGTACDDGNAATENDTADGNCNCAGTACPAAGTACDDGNTSTENDVEDGNCNCAGTQPACPAAGTACDDGNASTENDIEDGNCNCAGTQPACPAAGTACDDGNASTENDVEDGNCNCAGNSQTNNSGCIAPYNLQASKIRQNQVNIVWEEIAEAKQYFIQIRFVGLQGTGVQGKVRSAKVRIYAPANKDYEYRIQTLCNDGSTSEFTEWMTFNTRN